MCPHDLEKCSKSCGLCVLKAGLAMDEKER